MKPRIEKKLSKKLAGIVGNKLGKVWVDDEVDWPKPHWRDRFGDDRGPLTGKEERQNRQTRVSVNHMPSIGGELDYWGEGTDWHSLFYCAREWLLWDVGEPQFTIGPEGDESPNWPLVKERMTGAWVIRNAIERAPLLKSRH